MGKYYTGQYRGGQSLPEASVNRIARWEYAEFADSAVWINLAGLAGFADFADWAN